MRSVLAKRIRTIMLMLATGGGKCLGKGTPVLMYDGTIKPVEDVKQGDKLMGPDSRPRRVMSTCTGREPLYRVVPTKGDSYVVNESHILSLQVSGKNACSGYAPGLVNISVRDYLQQNKTFRHCAKGWRSGVDFQEQEVHPDLPAYILGAWLGDGNSMEPMITSNDHEVVDAWHTYAAAVGHDVRLREEAGDCASYAITRRRDQRVTNRALMALRGYGLIGNKHIPQAYKANTRDVRLEIMAGIIDTDGYLHNGHYDLVFKQRVLADDVAFVARSLGLAAYVKECEKGIKSIGFRGTYHRVSISGDLDMIPCRVARRQAQPRRQKKDVLRTGIRLEALGEGDYYGFEIDGDRLFLLGDFTVTHNTTIASSIMRGAIAKGNRVYFIADSIELVEQAARRFYEDGLSVGVIQGDHPWTDYSQMIQVATIQTLQRRWPELAETLKPALLVIDEAQVLHQAHEDIINECREKGIPVIGLSATPFRKGLGKVFDTTVVGATTGHLINQGYLVPATCYAPKVPDLAGVKKRSDGDWQEDALAEVMGDAQLMGDVVQQWFKLAQDRQTLVFASNVAHSRALCDMFRKAGIAAEHIDGYERDTERREQVIRGFREGRIQVLCNVAILTKGFDAPETSCLVIARPTKSLMLHYQMLGRGLRTAPGKTDCLVIDHAGNCLRNGVPEDPLPTQLDDGTGKRNLDRRQREKTDPVLKPCVSCGYVSSKHRCPQCGFAPEKREDVEVKEGELYPISGKEERQPKWSAEGVRSLYAELLGYAYLKGYKPGWAWHQCRSFTGTAPRDTQQIEPAHPSDKTMGIIKYMQIRKAKGKAKNQEVPA
jgi:superfamily II DNA or RNA helicase